MHEPPIARTFPVPLSVLPYGAVVRRKSDSQYFLLAYDNTRRPDPLLLWMVAVKTGDMQQWPRDTPVYHYSQATLSLGGSDPWIE